MANIAQFLTAIKEAVYGEDVRDSIHDAIQAINDEVVGNVDDAEALKKAFLAATFASIKEIAIPEAPVITQTQSTPGYYDWKNHDFDYRVYDQSTDSWSDRDFVMMFMDETPTGWWYYLELCGADKSWSNIPLLLFRVSENEFIEFGSGNSGFFPCFIHCYIDPESDIKCLEFHTTPFKTGEVFPIYGNVYTREDSQSEWENVGTTNVIRIEEPEQYTSARINAAKGTVPTFCRLTTVNGALNTFSIEVSAALADLEARVEALEGG